MIPTINGGKPIEILLVEDDPEQAELTRTSLRGGKVRNRLHWVEEGEDALAFLRRQGRHGKAPRPDLILLDLRLPGMSGLEVLAEIKQDPNLRRIPVVIMTSSDDEQDVLRAYDRHANCYVTKPVDMDKFIEVVRSIEDFWLTVVHLPAA
ncbi:MAG: response regulator [Gemmataceae bacterium]|nr:response regulator [Gemmataceae bacterium]